MPRYHFNVHDGLKGTSPDWEGIELTDLNAARREAVRFAGKVMIQDDIPGRHGREWHLEVTDNTGCPLFVVDFRISPAPAEAMA